jgi:hypothetical protein
VAELLASREAVLSEDRRYRYLLRRTWDADKPLLSWLMLNPSVADGERDDATIRICVGRARRLGCGGIEVVNLFGLIATLPSVLRSVDDPIGPENDRYLSEAAVRANRSGGWLVCGWGNNGGYRERDKAVLGLLIQTGPLWCLGRTDAGAPRHPLRISYNKPLERFQ